MIKIINKKGIITEIFLGKSLINEVKGIDGNTYKYCPVWNCYLFAGKKLTETNMM